MTRRRPASASAFAKDLLSIVVEGSRFRAQRTALHMLDKPGVIGRAAPAETDSTLVAARASAFSRALP
jgi:hypothetical protein